MMGHGPHKIQLARGPMHVKKNVFERFTLLKKFYSVVMSMVQMSELVL